MVNARSAGSEPVLLLCQDVVRLKEVLQSVVKDARIDLGDTANNCDASVLQRVSRVFVFFRNRNNIAEVPVGGVVTREKAQVEESVKEQLDISIFQGFVGNFQIGLSDLAFVNSSGNLVIIDLGI